MASNIGAVAGPSNMQASNLAPNQASSRAPNSSSAATTASKLPTFDFTRRKRWAELLVHELAEAIALVLSPSGKIWFCSPAVSDLLGWRDEELIDGDIFDLVNVDDQITLRQSLDNAVRAQMDMSAYVRLRAKQPGGVLSLQTSAIANTSDVPPSADPSYLSMTMSGDYGYAIPTAGTSTSVPALPPPLPLGAPGGRQSTENTAVPAYPGKEVLFELSGYPHVVPQDMAVGECKCIFAVAKPYPSRNTAMLNTFLELKLENERLQEKLADLRSPRTRAAFPRLNTSSMANTGSAPTVRPGASFRRPSLSQTQYDGRPTLSPLTTTAPAPNYTPTSATPYPMSVSMPMDALSSGLYVYPPQGSTSMPPPSAPSHVQVPSPSTYYPMDHSRPRAGSFSGSGAVQGSSSANGTYADYGLMPPTPTDRYNSYAASLGIGGGSNAGNSAQQPGQARLEDRRHSVGGTGLDMRVVGLETLRRQTDGSYTGGPHEVVPRSAGGNGSGPSANVEDEGEERGKKKKRRHAPDQFVCRTCGRTDSPEWRKGPDGPKTLCNACGLRWAKQIRKAPGEEGGKGGGADTDTMD